MDNDPVISALTQQVACYERLAKLAATQHECVQAGRVEQLLQVLSQRQSAVEELSRLEQVVGPAKREWGRYVQSLPQSQRALAEDLLAQTRQLLEAITAADRNDVMVLQQRKHNIGQQLAETRQVRQVNRSYAAAAYGARVSQMDVQR